MAKIAIKNEKITAFGGINFVLDKFDALLGDVIDRILGIRSTTIGYQYSEIIRALFSVYFCGGDCMEDINLFLRGELSDRPNTRVPSADTVLRAIEELTSDNVTYTAPKSGRSYDFNTAGKLNRLLVELLLATGQLVRGGEYDVDFDHQFIEAEKYDAKRTYKHFLGYSPGVVTVGGNIVYIENRDGNANVRFMQAETLRRFFELMESYRLKVRSFRADCGSYSEDIVKMVIAHTEKFHIRAERYEALYEKVKRQRKGKGEQLDLFDGEYTYRCILTNDWDMTDEEVILHYNKRGTAEQVFDRQNNDFGWAHLPKSFMDQNTVFLLLTAMAANFYQYIVSLPLMCMFGVEAMDRVKSFLFRFIAVPTKWVRTARQSVLNVYSKKPYDLIWAYG